MCWNTGCIKHPRGNQGNMCHRQWPQHLSEVSTVTMSGKNQQHCQQLVCPTKPNPTPLSIRWSTSTSQDTGSTLHGLSTSQISRTSQHVYNHCKTSVHCTIPMIMLMCRVARVKTWMRRSSPTGRQSSSWTMQSAKGVMCLQARGKVTAKWLHFMLQCLAHGTQVSQSLFCVGVPCTIS